MIRPSLTWNRGASRSPAPRSGFPGCSCSGRADRTRRAPNKATRYWDSISSIISFQTGNRQPEVCLFLPGDLADLKKTIFGRVEDRAAEQEAERDFAVFECVKVLGRGHIEVERAGDGEVDDGTAGKRRDDDAGVSPERAPERLTPALAARRTSRGAAPVRQAHNAGESARCGSGNAGRSPGSLSGLPSVTVSAIRSLNTKSGAAAVRLLFGPQTVKFRSST